MLGAAFARLQADEDVFAQIEISRWARFDYRPHVAIAWALPHSTVVEYRDTSLFLDDGHPHQLGVYVRAGSLRLLVDNRTICSAPASRFVKPSERKYFQVRTETSVPGNNSRAIVSELRLKRDADPAPIAFASRCILHRNRIFWEEQRPGTFVARGAFYPNESTFFSGVTPASRCKI